MRHTMVSVQCKQLVRKHQVTSGSALKTIAHQVTNGSALKKTLLIKALQLLDYCCCVHT